MLVNIALLFTLATYSTSSPAGGLNLNRYNGVQKEPSKNIAELVVATPELSTLLAAVQVAAGLVDTLAGPGPFTVFAPTNLAFDKIPKEALASLLEDKDALTSVLLRHVVPAKLMGKDVPNGVTPVATAGGEEIEVSGVQWYNIKYVTIKSSAGEATVSDFDIEATNGVVHIVDHVF